MMAKVLDGGNEQRRVVEEAAKAVVACATQKSTDR